MNTKLYDVGAIESDAPFPQRLKRALNLGQQRVLELEDGDSFVLYPIRITEGDGVIPNGGSRGAEIAAYLARWARSRRVRLAYRMIDKDTAQIWRLGAI